MFVCVCVCVLVCIGSNQELDGVAAGLSLQQNHERTYHLPRQWYLPKP